MAERNQIEQIKNNEPAPVIPGGPTRLSTQVDLGKYKLIQRRQEINALLLEASCAVGSPLPPTFKLKDQELLLQIAHEHDPNGNPLIRKQAVQALGQMRSLEVVESLWGLVADREEHESIRIQAIASLGQVAPRLAGTLLETCLADPSPLIRGAAARGLAGSGDLGTLDRMREFYAAEEDLGVQQRLRESASIITGRFETRQAGFKAPKKRRGVQRPNQDEETEEGTAAA